MENFAMNLFAESVETAQMNKKLGPLKKKTWTFQPAKDVAETEEEIKKILGNTRGLRTEWINAALRVYLPKLLKNQHEAIGKFLAEKKQRKEE